MTQGSAPVVALDDGLLQALLEHSSDVIALLDAGGTIRYTSPPVTRLLGYTPEELAGRNAFDLLHPDDLARCRALFSDLLEHRADQVTAAVRYRHKDGSWREIEGVGVNRLDDAAVRAVVINYRDLTARSAAEAEGRRAVSLLQSTLESTTDGILVVDAMGRIVVDVHALELRQEDVAITQTLAEPAGRLRLLKRTLHPVLAQRMRAGPFGSLAVGTALNPSLQRCFAAERRQHLRPSDGVVTGGDQIV